MTAFEVDHKDPPDLADAHAELSVSEPVWTDVCDLHGDPEPCSCRVPLSNAEVRQMRARWENGPMRYRGIR